MGIMDLKIIDSCIGHDNQDGVDKTSPEKENPGTSKQDTKEFRSVKAVMESNSSNGSISMPLKEKCTNSDEQSTRTNIEIQMGSNIQNQNVMDVFIIDPDTPTSDTANSDIVEMDITNPEIIDSCIEHNYQDDVDKTNSDSDTIKPDTDDSDIVDMDITDTEMIDPYIEYYKQYDADKKQSNEQNPDLEKKSSEKSTSINTVKEQKQYDSNISTLTKKYKLKSILKKPNSQQTGQAADTSNTIKKKTVHFPEQPVEKKRKKSHKYSKIHSHKRCHSRHSKHHTQGAEFNVKVRKPQPESKDEDSLSTPFVIKNVFHDYSSDANPTVDSNESVYTPLFNSLNTNNNGGHETVRNLYTLTSCNYQNLSLQPVYELQQLNLNNQILFEAAPINSYPFAFASNNQDIDSSAIYSNTPIGQRVVNKNIHSSINQATTSSHIYPNANQATTSTHIYPNSHQNKYPSTSRHNHSKISKSNYSYSNEIDDHCNFYPTTRKHPRNTSKFSQVTMNKFSLIEDRKTYKKCKQSPSSKLDDQKKVQNSSTKNTQSENSEESINNKSKNNGLKRKQNRELKNILFANTKRCPYCNRIITGDNEMDTNSFQ